MSSSTGLSQAFGAGRRSSWRLPGRPGLVRDIAVLVAGLILAGIVTYLAVYTQNPKMALALLGGVLIGTLILIRPVIGLYLLILSVPIQDAGALSVGSTTLTATKVIVILALAAWLVRRLAVRDEQPLRAPLAIPFVLLLLAMTMSLFAARSTGAALSELLRWVEAFLTYVIAADLIRTRKQLVLAVGVLLAGPLVEAIYGLRQFATGAGPASFAINDTLSRAYGTFGMPNSFAGYLGMGFSLAFALALFFTAAVLIGILTGRWPQYSDGRKVISVPGRFFRTVVFGGLTAGIALLILGGIIVSMSRGAWVGVIVGIAVMALASGKKVYLPALGGVLLILLLIASGHGNLLPTLLTERFTSVASELRIFDVRHVMVTPANFAVVERMAQWQTGASMFMDNPVFGVGIGNYNAAYAQYHIFPWIHSPGHAHNYYINIAAETGILGLLAYLGLVIMIFVQGFKAVSKTADPLYRAVAVGALGICGAVAAHNFFENLHVLSMGIQWATVLALFAVVPLIAGRNNDADAGRAGT
jgi:O-antigen ligase